MMSRPPLDESTLERGDAGRSSNLPMTLRVELCVFVEGAECRRAGHKALGARGDVGTYETIKTTKYIDGVLDSYLSRQDEDRRIAAQKTLKAEAMAQLTGSQNY